MKTINDILYNIRYTKIIGDTNPDIRAISFDSRQIEEGSLFVAVRGTQVDGHKYIDSALVKGAAAIICEEAPKTPLPNITYCIVENSSRALGIAASNFFDNPSAKFKLVGVTGTNGKTTIATSLYTLFRKLGFKAGLLSTIQNVINDKVIQSTHTTPDQIQLNALMANMAEQGCEYVFMEVSSHSIDQNRISGLQFAGGLFTNITHDHLDYHKTFDAYIKAKKKFFDELPSDAFAITNKDDKNGMIMLQNTAARKLTYGLSGMVDFRTKILENLFDGLLLDINGKEVWLKLVGKFNAQNLTAVYAVASQIYPDEAEILIKLSELEPVAGRFEVIRENNITGIVDYAHTPDAIKNVLETIQSIRVPGESIISIIGAGGDRDTSKRATMANFGATLSDRLILTSDNPRSEEPEAIINDMLIGLDINLKRKCLQITDRNEAIRTAVALANENDIILLAGKGHETYQEIKGVKHPFNDMELLKNYLKEKI